MNNTNQQYDTEYFNRHSDGLKLCIELIRCSSQLDRIIDRNLRSKFGQSISRFDLLAQLQRVGESGLSIGELGKRLISAKGNITGLINRMIKDELLLKTAKIGDRRSFNIKASAKGSQLFKQMADSHAQWVYELFADIDLESMNNMTYLLGDIRGALLNREGNRESNTEANKENR